MKTFLCLPGLVLISVMGLVSCGSMQTTVKDVQPYTYTGDKTIYPAVYQAIANGNASYWKNSQASALDPNTLVVDHVQVSDGLRLADFTLKISLTNGVVTYNFSNIRTKMPTAPDWSRQENFSQSGREQLFTSYFNTEIPKVMEDETLYAKAKEAADKAFGGAPGGGDLRYSLALQNPQNYLLYPAVGAAFTSLKSDLGAKTASLRDIDCLDNQFTIQGLSAARRPADFITYQVKIAYQNNQLIIEFVNIESGINAMQYTADEMEKMPRFDTQKTANQLKAQIEQNLSSSAAYNAAKKAFLADNAFLRRAFSPVTNALMDEFTTKVFKDGEVGLNITVLDVKKNEKEEFKNYATVISAGLYTEPSTSGAFVVIDLYTNDSALTRLKQSEKIMVTGQVVRIDNNILRPTIVMTK